MELDECKTDAGSLVATIPNDPEDWEDGTDRALDDFFDGRYFYFDWRAQGVNRDVRKLVVRRVETLVDEHPELTEEFGEKFSARTFSKRLKGLLEGDASSMLTAVYSRRVIDRINEHPDEDVRQALILPEHKPFREQPFAICDNCLYPSLYAPNRAELANVYDAIRDMHDDKQKSLSDLVFNDNRKGPNFFKLIRRGQGKTTRVVDGVTQEWPRNYRFTKYKARWVHQRLSLFCASQSIDCGEWEEMFSDRASDQPFRTGGKNNSVALPPDLGNDLHPLFGKGKR